MLHTLRYMENANLDDTTYYTIHVWTDKDRYGKAIDLAFDKLINAVMEMERLIKSGRYERVVVREEKILKRRENCEYSTSGVVKNWEYNGGN